MYVIPIIKTSSSSPTPSPSWWWWWWWSSSPCHHISNINPSLPGFHPSNYEAASRDAVPAYLYYCAWRWGTGWCPVGVMLLLLAGMLPRTTSGCLAIAGINAHAKPWGPQFHMLEYLGSRWRGSRPRLLAPDQDCYKRLYSKTNLGNAWYISSQRKWGIRGSCAHFEWIVLFFHSAQEIWSKCPSYASYT